jgi:hypothetical protein
MRTSYPYVERPVHVEIDACRSLAAAVIGKAIDDLRSTGARTDDRETARELLANRDGHLAAWCILAGLDPTIVSEKARRVLGGL